MQVPFMDLRRGVEALRRPLAEASERVLASGWFVLGPEVEAFENAFAQALGAAHAVGVASGTDAIELALRALDVGPGDEVVTQANTCVPTVAAVERTGATPVLCDVDERTGAMDPASLRERIGPRVRCVVPVHLYGHPADLDAILEAAGAIPVVEDCAQAVLATDRGRMAGTVGAIGAFSFYPTKNLGALGDGGAVVTSDPALAERLRRLRTYGEARRYEHAEKGVNSRLDELQAALLSAKLPHLADWTARRRAIADRYDEALDGAPVRPLGRRPGTEHAHHLYVVAAPDRDAFRGALAERGVGTLVHYPQPIHGHGPYAALGGPGLERSERLAREVVSLPLYPELTDAEVDHVATAAREAAG